MLLDEAGGATHAIDFLHPRKKPEPVNTRRRNLLITATVAVAALAAVLLVLIQIEQRDSEILQLKSQIGSMKSKVVQAEKQKQNTAAVQEFLDSDINWLDELRNLSQRLPSADDMLVTQLNVGTRMPSGGEINIDGFTRTSEQIKEIQHRLRADDRKVISKGGHDDPRRAKEKLRWRFDETVLVEPGSAKPPANGPPVASPSDSSSLPESKTTKTNPSGGSAK
jgi:hypothetical protein